MSPVASPTEASSCLAVLRRAVEPRGQRLIVYTVDVRSIRSQPFGRETFVGREDAERFIEEVHGDDPELANHLRIEERELGGGCAEPAAGR
jgi:hypothetical protein